MRELTRIDADAEKRAKSLEVYNSDANWGSKPYVNLIYADRALVSNNR